MSQSLINKAALILAVPLGSLGLAFAAPAMAAAPAHVAPIQHVAIHAPAAQMPIYGETVFEHKRRGDRRSDRRRYRDRYDRYDRNDRYDRGRRQANYGEPVYQDTRIWRGRDGRYYCQRGNGTTGLLIGAAVGGVIGSEVARRGDRTLGAILGAAGGAILGRAIDRSNSRCR